MPPQPALQPVSPPAAERYALGARHLAGIDGDWARLIDRIGPCELQLKPAREPYEALVRAVAYQQLHARAANAILGRLLDQFPARKFPAPAQLLATTVDTLRACGFSERKAQTLHGIARGASDGRIPPRRDADAMPDEELITRLVTLPGIGRWTVEMLLIYTLERIDILPVDDFGVREGYRFLKSLDTLPNRKALEAAGLACKPYRTVATWYLWRVPTLPDYARAPH